MQEKLAGSGWLLVGGVGAVVAWSGLADGLIGVLDGFLPEVWRRATVGILVFAFACALYFRSHWAATLAVLAHRGPLGPSTARRLEELAGDLERSAHVIVDNLVEVDPGVTDDGPRMYLDGAKAHANRLPQFATRLRHLAARLGDGSAGD